MYIKKKDRIFIDKMNKNLKLPKDFDKFVSKIARLNCSIILKNGNTHLCTYCNTSFFSTKKVNQREVCPKCLNEYLIRGARVAYNMEKLDIGLLDKIDDTFIIRMFRVHSYYCHGKYTYEYKEYYRSLLDDTQYVNNCFYRCLYSETVYIHRSIDKWRPFYHYMNESAIFYPYNIKKLLKGTIYQYSMIWDLVKHCPNFYIDLKYLLNSIPNKPSIELLIKLKLYKLALDAEKYNIKGSFEKRFGLPKEYYPFMKRHNLNSDELIILGLLKKKNIKLIRYLASISTPVKLQEFSKLTNINNLIKYSKMLENKFDFDMYLDYLENAKVLGFDLKCKKYLFPADLKESHDFVVKNVKKSESKLLNTSVENRYHELSNKIYKDNIYFIRPPLNKDDFINEAEQQQNCVYTNYFEKHAKGKCDIYFMRKLDEKDKSLVTIEVQGNKIVQKRIKGNYSPSNSENSFLEAWEQNILRKVA